MRAVIGFCIHGHSCWLTLEHLGRSPPNEFTSNSLALLKSLKCSLRPEPTYIASV